MSSLWTPSGEHPLDDEPDPPFGGGAGPELDDDDPTADVERLRAQLASAPAEVVIANHCYGLFELAAVYLSQSPPLLAEGALAIDAFGALVEGLGDRLGEAEPPLREALAQVRLAFVQIKTAHEAALAGDPGAPATGAEAGPPAG
jgi:hypothetical protein